MGLIRIEVKGQDDYCQSISQLSGKAATPTKVKGQKLNGES